MINELGLKDLWAKTEPFQTVLAHSINAGNVVKCLLIDSHLRNVREYLEYSLGLNEQEVIDFCSYIVALHDIGKCHPFFQEQELKMANKLKKLNLTQEYSYHFRHEKESQRVIRQLLIEKGINKELAKYIGVVIGKHHDKKMNKQGDSKELHPSIRSIWCNLQKELVTNIEKVFRLPDIKINKFKHIDGAFMTLWGLIILSDWIASGYYFYASNTVECENNVEGYNTWAYETAKKSVQKIGLESKEGIPFNIDYKDILEGLSDETLRPVQKTMKEYFTKNQEKVSMIVIEAPMGEGKTEVAEYAASRLGEGYRGLYVALPTSATSNQMYKRINKVLSGMGQTKANLIHSTSWMVEDIDNLIMDDITTDDAIETDDFLKGTRKGMLSMNCVGTVDQIMMSILPIRFSILRLLGMIGKVVIIDEIHAYDSYMSSILEVVLSWCKALKIPVIMLSATLPIDKRKQLIEAYIGESVELCSTSYPLITIVKENQEIEEVEVNGTYIKKEVQIETYPYLNDLSKVATLTERVKSHGGCMAIIMNTVKEAQEVYKEVKSYLKKDKDIKVILFHARFPARIRQDIENKCTNYLGKDIIKRPKKLVVIATQVLEQSLDIDFDWIVSAIAPIDLLLQRMGREQRFQVHNRLLEYKSEKFSILLPENEDYVLTKFIYSGMILDKTKVILERKAKLKIPEEIREIIEEVYSNTNILPEEYDKWFEYSTENKIKAIQGTHTAINKPDADEFGLAYTNYMTLDEDNETDKYIVAKTRFGIPTRRIAFLEEERFKEIDFNVNPTKVIAEEILQESLSLNECNVNINAFYGFLAPVEGKGLLKGILIYPMRNGVYRVDDKKIYGYCLDNYLGLEIIYKRKGGD